MSLADEVSVVTVPKKGPLCTVSVLIEQVPELRDVLDSDAASTAISRALRNRGHRITDTTIARHRRGDCMCGR